MSSGLGVCPDQIPMLLSTQLTLLSTQLILLLQPFIDTPYQAHTHSGSSSRSTDKQDSLPSAPLSLSSSSTHPLGVQLCWFCVGPFTPPSFCTYWSLCPRAREQCTKAQKEDGRRDLPSPPAPPGCGHALCLPTTLSGCT